MKHIIIGTAGHVDHGKSSLIKVLTGLEPDRLKEEKKRGITIDLGFAWLTLPDGSKAGIVDVPGHEDFVNNMLAGAGGIDLALLVIAADEGVMPQTEEHLEILKLLQIKRGLIVITKTDLVDQEWLDLVEEDIREQVADSFLADSPIFKVSSYTGEGIEDLRQGLFSIIEQLPEKDPHLPFREPIDRVFIIEGFGTVITGTVLSGKVKLADNLMLYPQEKKVRVRNIQVHEQNVPEAVAGQRTAINLAQVTQDDVERGEILAAAGSLDPSLILDVFVHISDKSNFTVKNRSQLHFHYGAAALTCQIRLFDRDELLPGEATVARLNFEKKVALKYGDPFVLRFFSPLTTVGGGFVLDPCPQTYKVKNKSWPVELEKILHGDDADRLYHAINSGSPHFAEIDQAWRRSGLDLLPQADRAALLSDLLHARRIFQIHPSLFISDHFLQQMEEKSLRILQTYHQKNPLKQGVKRESLRTGILPEAKIAYTDKILDLLVAQASLEEKSGVLQLPHFKVELSADQVAIQEKIVNTYQKAGFTPPDTEEILKSYASKEDTLALIGNLIDNQQLIRLNDQINIHPMYMEQAKDFIVKTITSEGSLKLADFRDHINSSRKYAVAILDYFDSIKLTRLQGDVRKLI